MSREWDDAVEYNREQYYTRPCWRRVQAFIGADVDGIVGPQTCALLAEWQASVGLKADGWLGPATRQEMGRAEGMREVRVLTDAERDICMGFTDAHESGSRGYAALNLDGEYEGWHDFPRYNEEGRRLRPDEKVEREDFKPHSHSKNGPNPGHVGVSVGKRQGTQKGGNVGKMMRKGRAYGGEEFYEVFTDEADAAIEMLTKRGSFVDRIGDGRRRPNTMPLDGVDMWEDPWPDRFREAAKYDWWQRAQDEVFIEEYWAHILPMAREAGLMGQDDLSVLYDYGIQFGPWGMEERLDEAVARYGDEVTVEDVIARFPRYHWPRRWEIIEKSEWWVHYVEEDAS